MGHWKGRDFISLLGMLVKANMEKTNVENMMEQSYFRLYLYEEGYSFIIILTHVMDFKFTCFMFPLHLGAFYFILFFFIIA